MRRAIAYTGDAVATGAIEQTIFFLGLAFILTANTFFGKNLYRLLAFILFMGLFTPFSRSVWISSFLTSIYWWYKTGMNKKQLCLALIVLLSISYFFWDSVYERYYQTFVFKDYKKMKSVIRYLNLRDSHITLSLEQELDLSTNSLR